jgi:DNA phosphorothioation-associated putative methyltransferase
VLFEKHKELFEPLMEFISSRGRLPDITELPEALLIRDEIGSLRRVYNIIRRVTEAEQWEEIREERSQDLLIYIGLARFDGRPRFSELPRDLQLDVRAFFSTYRRACSLADELLFSAGDRDLVNDACRKSSVGKLTPSALYVHESVLQELAPVLRIYEGCARGYIGAVEGANIIKLHRREPKVSYLSYPDFEKDPHPALFGSLIVPLQTFRIKYLHYADSKNPPILHKKEEFIPDHHPLHQKFGRLSRQEGKKGLFENPSEIGTREGWQSVLDRHEVYLRGHRLLRVKRAS